VIDYEWKGGYGAGQGGDDADDTIVFILCNCADFG
jgi:hypothetical protein